MCGSCAGAGWASKENKPDDSNITDPEVLKKTGNPRLFGATDILLLFHGPRPRHDSMGRRDNDSWSLYRICIREIIEKMGKARVQRSSTVELGVWSPWVLHRSIAHP